MIDERNYWLSFSVFSGIGPMKFKKLLLGFGSAKDAWAASKPDLIKVLGEKLADSFDKFRDGFSINDYTKRLQAHNVSFLILTDGNYPRALSQIKNPPFVLYIKGDKEILLSHLTDQNDPSTGSSLRQGYAGQAIAVVGTRKTTSYGREVTKMFTSELVAAGFVIVSGLAIGIDAISHKTAINNNGKTIAVLGCGVDCCFPRENQSLYNSIVGNGLAKPDPAPQGCVVSEYPLNRLPTKRSFPVRNRIIAGLSLGVLVTEGAEDSGSLITANYAFKFSRPVFAVPGPITSSLSKGPYKLIQKGAKLVTSANDILEELKIHPSAGSGSKVNPPAGGQNSKVKDATKEELKILKLLANEPLHFDELVRRTAFDSSKIGSVLSLMEIKGMVKSLEGGMFSI